MTPAGNIKCLAGQPLNCQFFSNWCDSTEILLLLLCSQLYLWDSPFSVRFLRMWPFLNPTIELNTFSLREWCMLGVFLLPAFFTRPGHECWDLLSLCMCAQTRPRFVLSPERVLGNGIRTHVHFKGIIPSTGGSYQDRIHDAASRRTASPTHCLLSYSGPRPWIKSWASRTKGERH